MKSRVSNYEKALRKQQQQGKPPVNKQSSVTIFKVDTKTTNSKNPSFFSPAMISQDQRYSLTRELKIKNMPQGALIQKQKSEEGGRNLFEYNFNGVMSARDPFLKEVASARSNYQSKERSPHLAPKQMKINFAFNSTLNQEQHFSAGSGIPAKDKNVSQIAQGFVIPDSQFKPARKLFTEKTNIPSLDPDKAEIRELLHSPDKSRQIKSRQEVRSRERIERNPIIQGDEAAPLSHRRVVGLTHHDVSQKINDNKSPCVRFFQDQVPNTQRQKRLMFNSNKPTSKMCLENESSNDRSEFQNQITTDHQEKLKTRNLMKLSKKVIEASWTKSVVKNIIQSKNQSLIPDEYTKSNDIDFRRSTFGGQTAKIERASSSRNYETIKSKNLPPQSVVTTQPSQVPTQTSSQVNQRRNDSSNIRNLLFGGYEPTESVQQTPQPSTKQIDDQQKVLRNIDDIENKINSKLQEIDSLFGNSDKKNQLQQHQQQSLLIQNALNVLDIKPINLNFENSQLQASEDMRQSQEIEQIDSGRFEGNKEQEQIKQGTKVTSGNNKKIQNAAQQKRQGSQAAPDKRGNQQDQKKSTLTQRPSSLLRKSTINQSSNSSQSQQQQTMNTQKSICAIQQQKEPENDIQLSNAKILSKRPSIPTPNTQNKIPPKNQPMKANQDIKEMMKNTNTNIASGNKQSDFEESTQSQFGVEYENKIDYLDKQLQTKNTENQKLKKKILQLEKQIEQLKSDSEKQSLFQQALQKEGAIEHTDERRIIILKSQNAQLTKMNSHLNDVLRANKKIMIEVDNILSDLNTMCSTLDLSKLEQKIPRISENVKSMMQRLKSATVVEQKQFNKRYEEDNPFYSKIDIKNPGYSGNRFDGEEDSNITFQLNRDKLLQSEQKLSSLLTNSLDLYHKCFNKKKQPNANQFLRFCEDLRQSIESLLLLGIGINPDESERFQYNNGQHQPLKDFIEKKILQKVDMNTHVLESQFNTNKLTIINKKLEDHLMDVSFWNNSKKTEKQEELARVIKEIQKGELHYIIEIYLKQLQINMIKAQYTKMFNEFNNLRTFLKSRVSDVINNEIQFNIYEKFQDMENVLLNGENENSYVKLWSIFQLHYEQMRKGFDRLMGLGEMNIRVNELNELTYAFEERIKEAKDKILKF